MTHAYDFLADRFEELNDDCGYAQWSQYFLEGLSRYGAGSCGLELGCGSGAFCRRLARAGYTMSGADISQPMLVRADFLARKEGLRIRYFQADAVNFTSPERYDFILSPNDCYNYIPHGKLACACRHAAAALKKGGIFWLDISSPYKLREKIANNVFADDREDVTYLVFNTLKEDRVEMDVTLFQRRGDGAFDRFDEHHTQYIHTMEEMRAALERAGFEILSLEGHCGEDAARSDRINFICRKKEVQS